MPDGLLNAILTTHSNRDVVRVRGDDATTYLQSQLSQDLSGLEVGAATRSFLLQPNGRVVGWFRLVRLGADEYLIDTESGAGPAVVSRLERFKLRSKITIALESWSMIGLRGPGADSVPQPASTVMVAIDWPGVDGVDLLVPSDSPGPIAEAGDADETDEWLRIAAGIPAMGREITEATIPGELGAWAIAQSVSFTKGCYTGQELIARVDSRGGNVPKPIRLLCVDGDDIPPVGAVLSYDGRESGQLSSVATDPTGRILALGIVARRVEPPATVTVTWVGGTASAHVDVLSI